MPALKSPSAQSPSAHKNTGIEARCAATGMRMTEQRRVIARVLADSVDHPDVEELYRRCVTVDDKIYGVPGELETIVRKGLPITLIVFSNASYGWIKASQKDGYEERYFSVDFTRTDHARIAEAYGLKSWRVEDPAEVETVIRRAVQHDGPSLVDIIAQPLEQSAVPVSRWMG